MNGYDSLAEAYVRRQWADKPEPMRRMLRAAFIAGTRELAGQAAVAAMQGLITASPKCREYRRVAQRAANFACELVKELDIRNSETENS